MVGSQIGSLIPSPFFGHNLCFKCSNGSCEPILNIFISIAFQWYKELFNPMSFDPLKLFFESSGIHLDSNFKVGAHLGVCGLILSFFYTFMNMKCGFWASLLAHTFTSPCFGHEPKARVMTPTIG